MPIQAASRATTFDANDADFWTDEEPSVDDNEVDKWLLYKWVKFCIVV